MAVFMPPRLRTVRIRGLYEDCPAKRDPAPEPARYNDLDALESGVRLAVHKTEKKAEKILRRLPYP